MSAQGPTAAAFREGRRFKAFRKGLADVRPLLREWGAVMVSKAQEAFRTQGRPAGSWRARKVPNVAGVVKDLLAGGSPKARRFTDRPALVDTGVLRNSITFKIRGDRTVDIGTSVPYASKHEKGGRSRIHVPKRIRGPLARFLRSGRGRPWRASLGWLFHLTSEKGRSYLEVRVPPRPFIVARPSDRRELQAMLRRYLKEAARGRA